MRSRYTAFVYKDANYLVKTHHETTRGLNLHDHLEDAFMGVIWIGLIIKEAIIPVNAEGFVSFEASFSGVNKGVMRERSRFVLNDDQRWYYVDGVAG